MRCVARLPPARVRSTPYIPGTGSVTAVDRFAGERSMAFGAGSTRHGVRFERFVDQIGTVGDHAVDAHRDHGGNMGRVIHGPNIHPDPAFVHGIDERRGADAVLHHHVGRAAAPDGEGERQRQESGEGTRNQRPRGANRDAGSDVPGREAEANARQRGAELAQRRQERAGYRTPLRETQLAGSRRSFPSRSRATSGRAGAVASGPTSSTNSASVSRPGSQRRRSTVRVARTAWFAEPARCSRSS